MAKNRRQVTSEPATEAVAVSGKLRKKMNEKQEEAGCGAMRLSQES